MAPAAKNGPCLVAVHEHQLYDITSCEIPTMRDLLELDALNFMLPHSWNRQKS